MIGTNGDSLGIRQLQQKIKELEEKNKTLENEIKNYEIKTKKKIERKNK